MRILMTVFCAALLVSPALAERTYDYPWIVDGATILGNFGNCTAELSSSMNLPTTPGYALAITKTNTAAAGYATAFLACIWGLNPGDEVSAEFWRHDPSAGYPRMRLWAHYNDQLGTPSNRDHDTGVNDGLAYGDNSFGNEGGWDNPSYTWTIPEGHCGIVIDAVVYGEAGDTMYLDDLSITIPNHAHIQLPMYYFDGDGVPTAAEAATWGGIKTLFK